METKRKSSYSLIAFFLFVAACIGYLVMENRTYTKCTITQTQQINGRGGIKVSFYVDEERLDSMQAQIIEQVTGCVAGTLEENASWKESIQSHEQQWILEKVKGVGYKITGTINDVSNAFLTCESPSPIIITAKLFRKDEARTIRLRTYPQHVLRATTQ